MQEDFQNVSIVIALTGLSVSLLALAQRVGGYESKVLGKVIAALSVIPILVLIRLVVGLGRSGFCFSSGGMRNRFKTPCKVVAETDN